MVIWKLRQPKPDRPTTWAEAIGGATFVFALFLLMYAVIPHEFITVADKYWNLSTSRYLIKSTSAIPRSSPRSPSSTWSGPGRPIWTWTRQAASS